MLMILARLVRSESFCAVVKVRSPHTGPEVCYIIVSRFTAVVVNTKLNILTFCLASDARDSHHGYIRPWECPPPPPALLTQDSMPRERRHLAGGTREGGSG